MDEHEFGIKKERQPSLEELLQLRTSTHEELVPLVARLFLVPENPSRQAYTILREIYLAVIDDFWKIVMSWGHGLSKEQLAQFEERQKKKDEIESWFRPPMQPLSLEQAATWIKGMKSELLRQSIMRHVGKRSRAGQPTSKRHLALWALDIKCAYPDTSLRQVTDILCPCGKDEHTSQCREQLRQQIKRLVKFLKTHGHDFTWERIQTEGWKVSH